MAEITPQQSIARHEVDPGVSVELPSVDDTKLGGFLRDERQRVSDEKRRQLGHNREIRKRLDEVIAGKVNWVGDVTLRSGAADITTVVSDDRVTPDCEISLMPLTANAASLVGKVYVRTADLGPANTWTPQPVGQFTVNHPILAANDFSFRYSIKG
jgi:hypothetical protein